MISVNKAIAWGLVLAGGALWGASFTETERAIRDAIVLRVTDARTGVPSATVKVSLVGDKALAGEWQSAKSVSFQLPEQANLIGRTVISIQLEQSNGQRVSRNVVVQTVAHAPVVTALTMIPRRTRIEAHHVTLNTMSLGSHREWGISNLDAVVGQETVTAIGPGMRLTNAMIRGHHMVQVGDRVLVTYHKGGIVIELQGVALESGRRGEKVSVRLNTNRIMEGVVTDAKRIAVVSGH